LKSVSRGTRGKERVVEKRRGVKDDKSKTKRRTGKRRKKRIGSADSNLYSLI
jgi:hypothetical protein